MSYKILKHIEMSLDPSSIDHAINEIKHFRSELIKTCNDLIRELTEQGVEIAKMQVTALDAVDTAELENNIAGVFFPAERIGVVYTPTPYALFVEYGTGVVGDGTYPGETANGWKYDYNDHGTEGWIYKNDRDGQYYWTMGYVARPFMYSTLEWLREAAPEIAKKYFDQM